MDPHVEFAVSDGQSYQDKDSFYLHVDIDEWHEKDSNKSEGQEKVNLSAKVELIPLVLIEDALVEVSIHHRRVLNDVRPNNGNANPDECNVV